FHPRVSSEDPEVIAALRGTGLRKGEGAVGRMALTHEPVQIPDIGAEGAYESQVRAALLRSGRRAVLALPLRREEHLIGRLVLSPADAQRGAPARRSEVATNPPPPGPPSPHNSPASSGRTRPGAASPKRPAATSPSSWPTCPTSYAHRSTPSSASRKSWPRRCS